MPSLKVKLVDFQIRANINKIINLMTFIIVLVIISEPWLMGIKKAAFYDSFSIL